MNREARIPLDDEQVSPPEPSLDAIRHPALEPLRPLPRLLVFVYLIVACVYLGWRPTTLNPAAPVFSGLAVRGRAVRLRHDACCTCS